MKLFLCGDVMTGRGIDQILPHPSDPQLYEPYVRSALGYVRLAEEVNGPIPRPVDFSYIWGDAIEEWKRAAPDLRIINLETSVTTSAAPAEKGIHYRMHPKNVPCLTAAQIDCCVLANNHVLDWSQAGLLETFATLHQEGLQTAGAGRSLASATAPAALQAADKGKVQVFAFGLSSSGIPPGWAAAEDKPGVNLLPDLSEETADRAAAAMRERSAPEDLVVASFHWGGNWGYEIPPQQKAFARRLIGQGAADVIHGHSSHHPKGIEVYRGKPILYGCGDFLNDYEGIGGHEQYRSELVLMYFVTMDVKTKKLARLEMTPMETKRFRLERARGEKARWLADMLRREGGPLGTGVERTPGDRLSLTWDQG